MQIEVLDAARAASNTVSVLVTNLTAHRSVSNVLHALGNYGAFTGAVATVTGVRRSRADPNRQRRQFGGGLF